MWDALQGTELDAVDLNQHLQDLCGKGVAESDEVFLVSRLVIVRNMVILGIRS